MYSAVAAIVTTFLTPLLSPAPALADPAAAPQAPQAPVGLAVPDIGARPMALGTLAMPGQKASVRPTATPTPTSPALQAIEKGRTEISALGDQLIQVGQDRDLARDQQAAAKVKYTQAEEALRQAQTAASDAAAQAMREAAAMPPGMVDPGLSGLGDLARLQRGQVDTQQAIARQIEQAQINAQIALDEQTLGAERYAELAAKYNQLNAQLTAKQTAQQALELTHQDELNAFEATETAQDSQLGQSYLAGEEAGRGADARAIQALNFALAQRGDPYVWSEEGPDQYDCSGLMYAAYRSVGFALTRVSRDQYWQTRNKVVDRYSLLPGDLLFFSSSSSWRGIHHVAMYAGDGMMVEAPRTGLNVRLTPVRWSRLFQATRVFGSVEGIVQGPNLGAPDPDPTDGGTTPTNPGTGTPSNPGTGTPSNPGTGTPSNPGTGTPSNPGTGTPSNPGTGTPSNPGTGTPSNPGTGTPSNPGTGTPSNPGTGTPSNPGTGTPSNPGTGTPSNPGTGTPSNPGTGTPSNPGTGTPTDPSTGTPANPDPGTDTPSDPPKTTDPEPEPTKTTEKPEPEPTKTTTEPAAPETTKATAPSSGGSSATKSSAATTSTSKATPTTSNSAKAASASAKGS
ncbi:NlpC/P60 family protein [Actinoplanes sp. NPDC049596]|uniref:NlpC/P60 family protein n=1 Tax=unclassified Actinoplanes TaxID=2626549 RepID=UPI003431ADAB